MDHIQPRSMAPDRRSTQFMNTAVCAAFLAFGVMAAFAPMWGLLPATLFAVFSLVY